jgi:hypothetical protein
MPTASSRSRLEILRKLFGVYPFRWKSHSNWVLDTYLQAIEMFDDVDVELGFAIIVRAQLPLFDGRYCPTPTQLAEACTIAQSRRLTEETRRRGPAQVPLSPDVMKTAESRERVRLLCANLG